MKILLGIFLYNVWGWSIFLSFDAEKIPKMQEMLQVLGPDMEQSGISAQAVVLAHTWRATVTMIASACLTMCVEKTTALVSGMMRILRLIAVSQVIYLDLCKTG